MSNKAVALQRKAAMSRSRLSDLVDDLQHQVSPGQLLDQMVGLTKGNGYGADVGRSITDQIARNPLPCLLIAAGIGWLILSERINSMPSKRSKKIGRKHVKGKNRSSV